MTESQWLACGDPGPMLDALGRDASDRKSRLYACACCRRVWDLLPDPGRAAVGVAERFADGRAAAGELAGADRGLREALEAARRRVEDAPSPTLSRSYLLADAAYVAVLSAYAAVRPTVHGTLHVVRTDRAEDTWARLGPGRTAADARRPADPSAQADLLRDLFTDRFRFVVPDHPWFTTDVMALANNIYDNRAFEHMPILADALQDAGCDSDAVLTHCRNPEQIHARGCWVVDLILGKV